MPKFISMLLAVLFVAACTSTDAEREERLLKYQATVSDAVDDFYKYCWTTRGDHNSAAKLLLADGFQETTSPRAKFNRRVFKRKNDYIYGIRTPDGAVKPQSCTQKYSSGRDFKYVTSVLLEKIKGDIKSHVAYHHRYQSRDQIQLIVEAENTYYVYIDENTGLIVSSSVNF
ncbi:MAG: hypothetical protein AAF478_00875 [Pseudomonadota bacterium]